MILLEVNAQSLADMKTLIDREVSPASSRSWPIPACSWLTMARCQGDARCRRQWRQDLRARGERTGHSSPDAVAAGHTSPKHQMLMRPTLNWRKCRFTSFTSGRRGARRRDRSHSGSSRNLPALSVPHERGIRPALNDAAKYVMTPPLRDTHHQRQLWRGLRTDDLQVVSTDHCTFCFNELRHQIFETARPR